VSGEKAVLDAAAALRYLEAAGRAEPLLLLYHPPVRTNPFQALLYLECLPGGSAAVPVNSLEEALAVAEMARGRAKSVLHLHWLAPVTERASAAAEAADRVGAFLARVDELRDAGCAIAWTVHNALPHDVRFPEAAVLLRRGIVERSIMIHVLSPSTASEVAPWFDLPTERVVHVPHPNYAGVYPDLVDRDTARLGHGLWPDELVLLAFGALRPYKGIPELLEAWRATAPAAPPRRLVVAGKAPGGAAGEELTVALAATPGVVALPREVPVEAVASLFRAADVAVMAHRQALNSGFLLLALTFGLPVVGPRMAAAEHLLDESVARLYDPADPDGLAAALRAAPELLTNEARRRAIQIAEAHAPRPISRSFLAELRRRLGMAT
jgi:glycosyltransferase involved in cell wall biosynthesis